LGSISILSDCSRGIIHVAQPIVLGDVIAPVSAGATATAGGFGVERPHELHRHGRPVM
jgi:hypothetical protein